MTDCGPRERADPVGDAVGVDDADLEPAVVGARVLEHFDAAEETPDVADEDAGRSPAYHGTPSTAIFALNGFARRFFEPVHDVGGTPEAVFERAVRVPDHRGVETGAGHDGEPLAVEAADIELPPITAETDRDRLLDVLRDPEVRREQVRGAGREDGKRDVRVLPSASTQRCTIPSPPQTKSSSAPSASAA